MSLEIGNVVRYIAKEDSGMHRGELGEVISVCQNGRIRVRVKNRPPQYVSADQVELVSATDHGIFDGGEKPEPAKEQPVTKLVKKQDGVMTELPDPAGFANLQVLRMWPRFDDGFPVMIGDFIRGGGIPDQVTLIEFDAEGYAINCNLISIENSFGKTVERCQDCMELVIDAARDAINSGRMTVELFEELAKRAQKLGDAS